MPRTGGGSTRDDEARPGSATAVRVSSAWMPRADCPDRWARFSNGSSTRKIAPALGALVKVAPEKPTMLRRAATPGTCSAISSARCCTASVRASEAPGGNCTTSDQIAAVHLRDEADRRLAECVEAEAEDDQHRSANMMAARRTRAAGQPAKVRRASRRNPIEGAEEAMDRPLATSGRGALGSCGLSSSAHIAGDKRQRDDQRNDGGAGDGERELAVELAGDAGDERRRHEHGAQHERDGDRAPSRPRPCS